MSELLHERWSYEWRAPSRRSWLAAACREPLLLARRVANAGAGSRNTFLARVHERSAWSHPVTLPEQVPALARELRRQGYRDALLARSFAMMRAIWAVRFDGLLSDDAIIAARGLLKGAVVELPGAHARAASVAAAAVVACLAGNRTHVAMASAEAAASAAGQLAPLFDAFGLSVAAVSGTLGADERRALYGRDVVYASHRDLANDILRDVHRLHGYGAPLDLHVARIAREPICDALLLRGLEFLVVCDADRVLIDEARMPLALSRTPSQSLELAAFHEALAIAARLREREDFTFGEDYSVSLTGAGRERVESEAANHAGEGLAARFWEFVRLAICAEHLLERDREYVVREGRVLLTDEAAVQPVLGAAWQGGLRQLLELREGCKVTPRSETLARSSYARLFRRYRAVAAVSGHASEGEAAFRSVYGWWLLCAGQRPAGSARPVIVADHIAKYDAIVQRVREAIRRGEPVLARVRGPDAAQALDARLRAAGIPCQIVQSPAASSDAVPPARSIAPGAVLLLVCAVDESLGAFLRACLGEHERVRVVLAEADETSRHTAALSELVLDACAGATIEPVWSLADRALAKHGGAALRPLVALASHAGPLPGVLARPLLRSATRRAEKIYRRMLLDGLRADEAHAGLLAFSGGID